MKYWQVAMMLFCSSALADVVDDPQTGSQMAASCDFHDIAVSRDSSYESRFVISRADQESPEFIDTTPFWGPDRESYLKLLKADTSVSPGESGWTSSIFVGSKDNVPFVIRIIGHASGEIRPYWINEDFLTIEVWWGRISRGVYEIDVSRAEVLSATSYNHFEETLPCKK